MKIFKKLQTNRDLVKKIKLILYKLNYQTEHYIRYVSRERIKSQIKDYLTDDISILEISESEHWKNSLNYQSFEAVNYPEFNICDDYLTQKYDLIIADNVWEHLKYPYKACKNIQKMLNPNGSFLIIVPFLVRVHNVPLDCTRWTEDGLRYFLEETGFDLNKIQTGSWGNRNCVISNLRKDGKWTRVGFYKDLKNESNFPVQVWAIATI